MTESSLEDGEVIDIDLEVEEGEIKESAKKIAQYLRQQSAMSEGQCPLF